MTAESLPAKDTKVLLRNAALLLACRFLLLFNLADVFVSAEDAGENLVYVLQLAWEVEGVFDLLARDFAGDLFVGQDELMEV